MPKIAQIIDASAKFKKNIVGVYISTKKKMTEIIKKISHADIEKSLSS